MSAERHTDRIVEYHANQVNWLIVCAWSLLAGLLFFALSYDKPNLAYLGWGALGTGAIAGLRFLWRLFVRGKPALVLSPEGIVYRIERLGEVFIPWQEVRSVDTLDFTFGAGRKRFRFKDVTVVLVSEEFYQAHLHVDSLLKRGPYWGAFFRPKSDVVEVVFHHDQFRIAPQELREPIETRWHAFRDRAPSAPADRSAFGREGAPLIYGTRLITSPRIVASLVLPVLASLVIASNLAGLWETRGQANARVERQEREAIREEERLQNEAETEVHEERDRM